MQVVQNAKFYVLEEARVRLIWILKKETHASGCGNDG
jgi:uncharacterized protein YhbP (UPF0306 family)